eukprot:gene38849-47974_t
MTGADAVWADTTAVIYYTETVANESRILSAVFEGIMSVVAGGAIIGYDSSLSTDGYAPNAVSLQKITALWGDTNNNLYFADVLSSVVAQRVRYMDQVLQSPFNDLRESIAISMET